MAVQYVTVDVFVCLAASQPPRRTFSRHDGSIRLAKTTLTVRKDEALEICAFNSPQGCDIASASDMAGKVTCDILRRFDIFLGRLEFLLPVKCGFNFLETKARESYRILFAVFVTVGPFAI